MFRDKSIYDKYPIDSSEDEYDLSSCSAYDCTGLIPASINDENEAESYEELYPYLPPNTDEGFLPDLEYMD